MKLQTTAGEVLITVALAAVASVGLGCDGGLASVPEPVGSAVTLSEETREGDIRSAAALVPMPAAQSTTEIGNGAISLRRVVHHVDGRVVLDPLVQSATNRFPFAEVYAGLVRISSDLAGHAVPDLAKSWRVSEDGLRYTFTLRDGLRFSDGTPLSAADFKWSWERALTPAYSTASALEVLGPVSGAAEMVSGEARSLRGVTVIDEVTLAVELIRPHAHFVHLMAHPVASVLSERNVSNWGTLNWVDVERSFLFESHDSLEFETLPIGAGPFRIAANDGPQDALLEPNPFRWSGAPEVDEIVVTNLYQTRYLTLRYPTRDEFDTERVTSSRYAWRSNQLAAGGLDRAFDGKVFSTAPEVTFLALNTAIEPFDDLHFRRALFHAARRAPPDVPHVGVPENPASGLLPPRFLGHAETEVYAGPRLSKASDALSQSRYASGAYPSLEFLNDGSARNVDFFDRFSAPWVESLGLDARTRVSGYIPDSDWGLPKIEIGQAMQSGTLQMRYVHVEPRYPDPCAILCRIPDLFGPKAQTEETRLLREMLHDAAATADRAARIAKYQAIEAHILDRALVIPAYWDDGTVYELVKPYISGYKIPAYGGSRYEDVVVDTTHPDYPAGR